MADAALAYACVACGTASDRYALKCPACGKGVVCRVQRPKLSLVQSPVSGLTSINLHVKEVDRVPLGMSTLDRAFGSNTDGRSGFPVGKAVLLAGDPGAGKSTLGMLIGDAFQRAGAAVLLACSESDRDTFSLMALRTGLGSRLSLLFTQNVSEVIATAEAMGAALLVVDQLHKLEPRTAALDHANRLVDFTRSSRRSLLLIGERAKGTGTMRGDFGIEYGGDVTLGLEKPVLAPTPGHEESASDPRRWLMVTKNRHGPEGRYPLLLTERGWTEPAPATKESS